MSKNISFFLKKGVTLVEVLVAVSVIVVLSSIAFLSISSSRKKGNDIKGIADITQIQIALENYRRVEGRYPNQLIAGESLVGLDSELVFMSQVPSNFNYTNITCGDSNYNYAPHDDGGSYSMYFCLTEKVENYAAGLKRVTPDGIGSPTRPLLDSFNWALGSGSLSKDVHGGSFTFTQNGSTSENERVIGVNPFGQESIVWETRPSGNNDADGGWLTSTLDMPIDSAKKYRFSVWFKKTSADSGGRFYLGFNGFSNLTNTGVFNLTTGALNTNPYFFHRLISDFDRDKWYLVVGHTHPHDTTATVASIDSGVYDINGNKLFPAVDFKWGSDNNYTRHRTYHYYSTLSTPRLQFFDPRIYLIDGSEPSINEMLHNLVFNVY